MKTVKEKFESPVERMSVDELKRLRPMHAYIIDGIITGVPHKLDDYDITSLANNTYFSFEELSPLLPEERRILEDVLPIALAEGLNSRLAKLFGDVYFDGKEIFGIRKDVLWTDYCNTRSYGPDTDIETLLAQRPKARRLSVDEKLYVAFGISTGKTKTIETFFKKIQRPDRASQWGNRPLLGEYGYMGKPRFVQMCSDIRTRTGKTALKALDIGGGVGKALFEMKKVDADIETTNLTLEEEPIQLPVDHLVHCSADRMPASFFEQYDIILSNVSFRYYALPHKALENAVLALSVGGEAKLNIGCDRVPHSSLVNEYYAPFAGGKTRHSGAEVLIKRVREKLQRLEALGYVKLTYHSPDPKSDKWGTGYYEIVKLKSISVEDFLNA